MKNEMKWHLNKDGVLFLSGEGRVPGDSVGKRGDIPWAEKNDQIRCVRIEEGITELSAKAFMDCKNLEMLVLPKSLKRVHYGCFSGCLHLKKVITDSKMVFLHVYDPENTEDKHVITFGMNSFYGTPWALEKWGIFYIREGVLIECFSAEKILEVPEGVHTIAKFAFHEADAEEIKLPEGIRKIEGFGFGDTRIKHIKFPESIEEIGPYAFSSSRIEEIIIPYTSNVVIHNAAFNGTEVPFKLRKGYPIPDGYELALRSAGKAMGSYQQIKFQRKKPKKIEPDCEETYGLLTTEALGVGDSFLRRIKNGAMILGIQYDEAEKKVLRVRSYRWDPWELQALEYKLYPVIVGKEGTPKADVWKDEYRMVPENWIKSEFFVKSVPGELERDSDLCAPEGSVREVWFWAGDSSGSFGYRELQVLRRWLVTHDGYKMKEEISL